MSSRAPFATPLAPAAEPVGPARDGARTGAVSRLELTLLILVLALALTARMRALDAVGLGHYDEGVYVTSAVAVAEPGQSLFPNQVRFSPPFFFGTAGLAYRIFGGAPDRVLILLNVIMGTLTVAALWLIGRAWFGPRAGLVAATLLATNQFHILLSRVALTDIAFCFWFILALAAVTLAVERRDYRCALLAGALAGLAWNTKYHGWFVFVISGAALIPLLWHSRSGGAWRKPAAVWLTAAGTAGLLYVPWALYVGDTASGGGGYGGIIAYFADMLRGEWFGNVQHHAAQQWFLEGALSRSGVLAALAAGLLLGNAQAGRRAGMVAVLLGFSAVAFGQTGAAAALTLAAAPLLFRSISSFRSRVLVAWLLLWIVAAPFYQPYARLLLPFTCAMLLCSGLVLDRALGVGRSGLRPGLAAGGGALALFVLLVGTRFDNGNPWRNSRQLADAASVISAAVPDGARIHVVGEPSLAHYLLRIGRSAPLDVRPATLDTLTAPAYIVTGIYADRAPPLANRLARLGPRLTHIRTVQFDPNDLRLLDDMSAADARRFRAVRDTQFDLHVYRLEPERP